MTISHPSRPTGISEIQLEGQISAISNKTGSRSREELSLLVKKIIARPDAIKYLSSGRQAYWHSKSGTIVILNPRAIDESTIFVPKEGKAYLNKLK